MNPEPQTLTITLTPPAGFRFTGEFRHVKPNEFYLNPITSRAIDWGFSYNSNSKYWVLEPLPPRLWRAEKGKEYWFITSDCSVDYLREQNMPDDTGRYKSHNYFRTQEAAEQAAQKVRELLKQINPAT